MRECQPQDLFKECTYGQWLWFLCTADPPAKKAYTDFVRAVEANKSRVDTISEEMLDVSEVATVVHLNEMGLEEASVQDDVNPLLLHHTTLINIRPEVRNKQDATHEARKINPPTLKELGDATASRKKQKQAAAFISDTSGAASDGNGIEKSAPDVVQPVNEDHRTSESIFEDPVQIELAHKLITELFTRYAPPPRTHHNIKIFLLLVNILEFTGMTWIAQGRS